MLNKSSIENKKQLLDPLNVMCKIAMLSQYQLHTRISIKDHIIRVQLGDTYQFIYRMMNGDGRDDICLLFSPILRLIKWFIASSDTDEGSPEYGKLPEFRRLVHYMCDGLKMLQKTYHSGNVIFALQYFIDILEGSLRDEKFNIPITIESDEEHNFLDYNKVKTIWDTHKLTTICQQLDKCYELRQKEDSATQTIVYGILSSVQTILDTVDKQFQELIKKSNEG